MCRIDYCGEDGGKWLKEPHVVKAKKDHTCGDCGRQIAKGEQYTYAAWLWEGQTVIPIKMCAQCIAAGAWLRAVCNGHLYPGVVEELREHWDEEWSSGAMLRAGRFADRPLDLDQMTTVGFVWLLRAVARGVYPLLPDGGSFLSFIDWRQWPNLVGAIEAANFRVQGMIVWDKTHLGLGNGFRFRRFTTRARAT